MSDSLINPGIPKWLAAKAARPSVADAERSAASEVAPQAENVVTSFTERRGAQVAADVKERQKEVDRRWKVAAGAMLALTGITGFIHWSDAQKGTKPEVPAIEEIEPMPIGDDWVETPVVTGESTAWGMAAEDFNPTTESDQHEALMKSIQEQARGGGSPGVDSMDTILTPPNK